MRSLWGNILHHSHAEIRGTQHEEKMHQTEWFFTSLLENKRKRVVKLGEANGLETTGAAVVV